MEDNKINLKNNNIDVKLMIYFVYTLGGEKRVEYSVSVSVDYRKILIDPFNPRFNGELEGFTQEEIMNYIKQGKDYKELLKSMKKGIRWINLIVVRPICDVDNETKKKLNVLNIGQYDYIAIEGNTRLACMHDSSLEKESNNIPVTIFKLEENERNNAEIFKNYELEIMYIQGQANILKVKDWKDMTKCKHIYNTFLKRKAKEGSEKTSEIISDLAGRFSGKTNDVKKALIRCIILNTFNIFGYKINEKCWGYLEVVETNEGKSYMGLNEEYELCSDMDEVTYNIIYNRYKDFYERMTDAQNRNINSKTFRQKFKKGVIKNSSINTPLKSESNSTYVHTHTGNKKENRNDKSSKNNKRDRNTNNFDKNQNKKIILEKIDEEY